MNEIISSILEAEEKADEIVKTATENCKKISLDGDFASEQIKEEAITKNKNQRKQVLSSATEKGEELYNAKIEEGKKQAEVLIDTASKNIEEAVKSLINEILG